VENKVVHLAFASDAEGVEALAVAAFSTLEFCSRPVHVWVIEDGISRRAQERLETTWRRCSTYSGSTFIPMSSLPIPMPSQWARRDWPLTAAARFQVAEVLPKDVSRCLYLDIDILAGVDVAELYDLDLGGNPIGMAVATRMPDCDKEYLKRINLDPEVYCNSGVALIDLDAWRREGAGKGLISVGRAMPPNIWFYDQDMLNTYFKGRCFLLEERWNYRDSGILPDGKIQHFAGSTKPWKVTAAAAPAPGHVAWHGAKRRSGFEPLPIPAYVKWKKSFNTLTAKVQRRITELVRKRTGQQTGRSL
jgi:lipopolysaccharide biosynthesis glycosyltransferase